MTRHLLDKQDRCYDTLLITTLHGNSGSLNPWSFTIGRLGVLLTDFFIYERRLRPS